MKTRKRVWWIRCTLGAGVLIACTGMARPWVTSRQIEIRPEIDLLLDDIRDEPTPDNILELVSKSTSHRSAVAGWADGSLDPDYLAPNEVAHVTRYLREQYPFERVDHRLAYEKESTRKASKLKHSSRSWMDELEQSPHSPYEKSMLDYAESRADALRTLHSEEVVAFINRDGEGVSRMPTVGVEYLVLPDIIPVRVDADSGPMDRWMRLAQRNDDPGHNHFFALHADYRRDFAETRNGLVIDIKKVAGFAAHAVTRRKDVMTEMQSSTSDVEETSQPLWRVEKLQLVSLLKYDRPKVYVSEFLPAMTELDDIEMRELQPFEQASLQELYEGEDLVRKSHDDNIQMLGSLRATKDCQQCHHANRGELLGAFSYQLARVTPQPNE